jgi:hypothetical protein
MAEKLAEIEYYELVTVTSRWLNSQVWRRRAVKFAEQYEVHVQIIEPNIDVNIGANIDVNIGVVIRNEI